MLDAKQACMYVSRVGVKCGAPCTVPHVGASLVKRFDWQTCDATACRHNRAALLTLLLMPAILATNQQGRTARLARVSILLAVN